MHGGDLFLALALIWLFAKVGGELAERSGQPAVLGELLAGTSSGQAVWRSCPIPR